MFAFRRTRLAIYGVAGLLLWISTGHGPALVGNVIETANAKLTSLIPGSTTSAPQAALGTWKTCDPVAVYVNPGPLGDNALAHSQEAIDRMSDLTGMPLRYAGTTTITPTNSYVHRTQDKRTIVIAWTTPAHTDLLTDNRIGGAAVRTTDSGRILNGSLAINTDQLDRYTLEFGAGRTTGNALLHELAHTLGAPHAGKDTLMNTAITATSPDGLTEADLQALQATTPDC